jgi:flagellar motor protein MotB
MSFSDILSALLMLFILAAVILILQLIQRKSEFEESVKQIGQGELILSIILRDIHEELGRRGIEIEVSEEDSVIRIPNELLGFETGEFEIQPRYASTALVIGSVIHGAISKDDRLDYLDTVFIEGHTDSRPFPGFLGKGNWGLSTFRAISLWQFWSERLPVDERLDELNNRNGRPLFSVSGYAATRPVSEGNGPEDLQRNRRVDIRFTIRRPKSEEYRDLGSMLGEAPP